MADFSLSPEFLRLVPAALAGIVRLRAQGADPYAPYYDEPVADPYAMNAPEQEFSFGTLVFMALGWFGINVLFGFWAKSRAEDHGVDPWLGFASGFVLGWIGVLIVPVFRRDRIFVPGPRPVAPQYGQPVHAPNPIYAPQLPAAAPYPNPAYPPPPAMPPAQAYPQPAAPPQMLVADAAGYVNCPGCGARTKAGRKTCMNCGGFMPAVYNPHVK